MILIANTPQHYNSPWNLNIYHYTTPWPIKYHFLKQIQTKHNLETVLTHQKCRMEFIVLGYKLRQSTTWRKVLQRRANSCQNVRHFLCFISRKRLSYTCVDGYTCTLYLSSKPAAQPILSGLELTHRNNVYVYPHSMYSSPAFVR